MEFEVLPTDDNLDRAILTDSVERNKYLLSLQYVKFRCKYRSKDSCFRTRIGAVAKHFL